MSGLNVGRGWAVRGYGRQVLWASRGGQRLYARLPGDSITHDRQSGTSYTAERPSLTMVIMSQPSHLQGILSDKLCRPWSALRGSPGSSPHPMAGYRDVGAAAPIPGRLANVYKDTLRRLMPPPDPVSGKSPERIPLTIKGMERARSSSCKPGLSRSIDQTVNFTTYALGPDAFQPWPPRWGRSGIFGTPRALAGVSRSSLRVSGFAGP